MIKVTRANRGEATLISISGVVDDAVDLNQLLGEVQGDFHVHCANILRFNSVGVKSWISYFEAARRGGARLFFHECPPQMVEQINSIVNFASGSKIVTIQLPYGCPACKHRHVVSAKVDDLKKNLLAVPAARCPSCNAVSEFEELAEDYLSFIERA